jgi:hypothetical protein
MTRRKPPKRVRTDSWLSRLIVCSNFSNSEAHRHHRHHHHRRRQAEARPQGQGQGPHQEGCCPQDHQSPPVRKGYIDTSPHDDPTTVLTANQQTKKPWRRSRFSVAVAWKRSRTTSSPRDPVVQSLLTAPGSRGDRTRPSRSSTTWPTRPTSCSQSSARFSPTRRASSFLFFPFSFSFLFLSFFLIPIKSLTKTCAIFQVLLCFVMFLGSDSSRLKPRRFPLVPHRIRVKGFFRVYLNTTGARKGRA